MWEWVKAFEISQTERVYNEALEKGCSLCGKPGIIWICVECDFQIKEGTRNQIWDIISHDKT